MGGWIINKEVEEKRLEDYVDGKNDWSHEWMNVPVGQFINQLFIQPINQLINH